MVKNIKQNLEIRQKVYVNVLFFVKVEVCRLLSVRKLGVGGVSLEESK
jgi:hypothetical protein